MPVTEQQAADDALARGYHNIPDDEHLQRLSFIQLATVLSSCESGTARFSVVEREMKKHLAKDQAKINRFNIGFGACIGGIFGLLGVVLGIFLKNSLISLPVAPADSVLQLEKVGTGLKLPNGSIVPNTQTFQPSAKNSIPMPMPIQSDSQIKN
jgi:hypothetical protein